jgi:hypothetical protein
VRKMVHRGYTLAEVRPCVVSEDGDMITVDETHKAYPRERKPGLGDRVAAVTKALGIPECDGCKKRREWLNAAGRRLGFG